jgi:hypothetical protein
MKHISRSTILFISILIIVPILSANGFASPLSTKSTVISLQTSNLEVEGWTLSSISEDSYLNFTSFWADLGIETSDYLMNDIHPTRVTLLIYNQETSDATVYIEIHTYESEQNAETEFSLQKSRGNRATIMQRFLYGQRIYQDGPYLIFVFSNEVAEQTTIPYGKYGQIGITLVDSFFVTFFNTLSPMIHSEVTTPPLVDFTGKIVWGVQPGDLMTWTYSHSTFTGSIGTGMSSSSGSGSTTWEIIEITENKDAILIAERRINIKIYNEYFSSIFLDATHSIYTWHSIDDGPIVLESGSLTQAAIFPLFVDGASIDDFLGDEIGHLPEKTFTESGGILNAYGKTSSGMGFTPLVTQWIDISIHKGTGLLVSYDSYYNDNEFSITVSRAGELTETNFDLGSRVFNVQIISMDTSLSSEILERGEILTVRASLKDISGIPLDGAIVTAIMGSEEVILSSLEEGVYEGSIETLGLSVADYIVELTAEKEGFESRSDSKSIKLKTPSIILSLNMDETVRKGGKLTIDAEIRDVSDNPLEDAKVTAAVGDLELELSEVGEGLYRVKLESKELEVGAYSLVVKAEKEGYESASIQETIEVAQSGGIPGSPNESIFLGISLGIITLWLIHNKR